MEINANGGEVPLSWRHLQQLDSSSDGPSHRDGVEEDDTHSMHSLASRVSNAGSAYSAATFYSFSTSNYSGFSGAGDLARRGSPQKKRHHVHPQDLDPNACYDVDWVQDDSAFSCMVCTADFSPLLRRKHHCRACGRVVCSSCSRARVLVVGLRGPQKACTDCVRAAEKLRACESISEDFEGATRNTEEVQEGDEGMERVEEEGEEEEEEDGGEEEDEKGCRTGGFTRSPGGISTSTSNSTARVERKVECGKQDEGATAAAAAKKLQEILGDEEEFIPRRREKNTRVEGKRSSSSTVGMLAMGFTALAVGSVLALNPKLLSTVSAVIGRVGGRR